MNWLERHLGGHIMLGHLVIYGWNAMHVALNWRTKRWGWICFHPTMKVFGRWWPWYFYVSPNGTPGAATWGIGPGFEGRVSRRWAPIEEAKKAQP